MSLYFLIFTLKKYKLIVSLYFDSIYKIRTSDIFYFEIKDTSEVIGAVYNNFKE